VHDRLKVEGREDLVRDTETGAIVNTNREEYLAWKREQDAKQREANRLDNLEKDMSEIKDLLKQLLNKG
jgi:myo-inositol-hexaphosphate 3-phosphohydrolase